MASLGFTTQQVHGGDREDDVFGARIEPIYMTAGFRFEDAADGAARFGADAGLADDDQPGYVYTRVANPTNASLERRLTELEGGSGAILVGSGQAAVSVALLGALSAGDHVLAASNLYEGTKGLLTDVLARFGVTTDYVDDVTDSAAWRAGIRPNTRVLFAESIGNPRAQVLDVRAVADIAHEVGAPLIVDNTLATPYLLRPLDHGADVVVHSASKFLAGHGSALGGVVVTAKTQPWVASGRYPHLTEPVGALGGRSYADVFGEDAYLAFSRSVIASRLGPTISPFNSFLIRQGVETLSLRVARQSESALALARWLETRPEVARVDHPGLESNPSAALAQHYLPRGQGAVFSVTLRGGFAAAAAVVDRVHLFSRMSHLGDVRSLVLHAATTSHAHRTAAEREAAGIDDGLLRLSVGIEDVEDLVADLTAALDSLSRDASSVLSGSVVSAGERASVKDVAGANVAVVDDATVEDLAR